MLGVGIDWAETFHVIALGRPGEGVVQVLRVEHSKPALEGLLEQLRALEPAPDQVRVVLETRHGLLVERLLEAGFVVVPVNPDLIARRRGPAKKKDDVEDARIACLLALDRFQPLRPLIPHGELAAELRLLGRDDERACQDERRLLNRLRADLLAVFPAAVQIAGPDMGAPTFLRMLQRWPTATALAGTSRQELVTFARAAHSGYPERFADRVQQALGREHFTARQTLAQAKVDTIQLMVAQLLLIGAQRRTWERRMGQLLLGAPRRRGGALPSQAERDRGQAVPGGEIYLSFPGLGDRLAARIAGEIGDHPEQFQTPNSLQCYAGQAPVTRRSGKRELVITRRLACNRHLADAVHKWAFASLRRSAWGQGLLRQPTRPRQGPPRRAPRPRQPLAGDPLALPPAPGSLSHRATDLQGPTSASARLGPCTQPRSTDLLAGRRYRPGTSGVKGAARPFGSAFGAP